MKETVLLFHIEEKELKLKIEQALFPFHIRLRKVALQDYNKTLGQLAGLLEVSTNLPPYEGAELPEPMMIFAGISDRKLDQLLLSLRNQQVRLPYKGILTPTNQAWTPTACFEELKAEHEAMQIKN